MARWIRSVALVALALGGCGAPSSSVPTVPSVAPSGAGSLGPFPIAGCPLGDEAACEPASAVATAIVEGDGGALVERSRADTFICSELDLALFPGCATADVLEGHAIGLAEGPIEVLAPGSYRHRLDELARRIDPGFSDELGDGRARVLGASSCGPSDPARRSHYVAWTAATALGAPVARLFGSYELTFRDDGWRVGILYLDPDRAWVPVGADPLPAIACGVRPWPSP